jgi:hypothetical protein
MIRDGPAEHSSAHELNRSPREFGEPGLGVVRSSWEGDSVGCGDGE